LTSAKHNYSQQQHKHLNNDAVKLLAYAQTKPDETKDCWRAALYDIQPGNVSIYI